jgi:hypothetical protein
MMSTPRGVSKRTLFGRRSTTRTMIDLDDGFTFEIAAGSRIDAETDDGGWRFSVRAQLDGRFFEQFVLDVNIAVDDPRPVDRLTLRPVLHFASFASPTIAAVPVAFHLAEKLHAWRTDLFDRPRRQIPTDASTQVHEQFVS